MKRRRGKARKRRYLFFVTYGSKILLFVLLFVAGASVLMSRVETPAGSTEPMGSTGPLAGQVIFIDPGHGGYDPGACGKKYLEKDIVLNVGLLLGVRLEKSGAEVIYSRTGDYSLWTEEIDDRDARINLIEKANPTIIISLHCNAFTDPYEYGAQVFYNSSKHPDSQKLAELIQDILKEETGTYREISSKLDHFILNHSDGLAVTVELGFLSNPSEEELLGSHDYQQKLADYIYRAVLNFVNPAL